MIHYELTNNRLIVTASNKLNARVLNELAILLSYDKIYQINEIVFDFTKTRFIKLGAVLSLICFTEVFKKKISELGDISCFFSAIIPDRLRKIFNSLGFERFFDQSIYFEKIRSEGKYPGYLPILKIPCGWNSYSFESFASNFINKIVDETSVFLKNEYMCFEDPEIYDFINANLELLTNIYDHSNGIGFAGISYTNKNGITCCYYDLGVGFEATASNSDIKFSNSISAIKWAVEPNNTGKKNENRGAGLSIVKNFIQKNNGILEIRSGNGRVQWHGNELKCTEIIVSEFNGSQININIPPKK